VHLSPRDAAIAYLYSRGLVDHIVRQRSEADLRRACRELLRTRHLVRALEKTTRASPVEHDRAFRRELLGER
jgi:hypothetical protein